MAKSTLPLMSTPMDTSGVTFHPTLKIPVGLSKALVDSNLELKRWQEDLLNLTSFNDNSTLHWRPSWFAQAGYATGFWTLHNPPNVVTELLPMKELDRPLMTRRMRQHSDKPALYIKSWEHWYRYCEMYGVPIDFLCREQIALLRLGLWNTSGMRLYNPPVHALYPEPQPIGHGHYILDRSMHHNLPRKFHRINDDEIIVVHSNGALEVVQVDQAYSHENQWTHYDGRGGYVHDWWYTANDDIQKLKMQGAGRRWTCLPWTKEQEVSCRPMTLRLRMGTVPRNISKVTKGQKMKSRDPPVASSVGQNVTDAGMDEETEDLQQCLEREYDSVSEVDFDDDMEVDDQGNESQDNVGNHDQNQSGVDEEGEFGPGAASKACANVTSQLSRSGGKKILSSVDTILIFSKHADICIFEVFNEVGNEQDDDNGIRIVEKMGMTYEYEHGNDNFREDGAKDHVAS